MTRYELRLFGKVMLLDDGHPVRTGAVVQPDAIAFLAILAVERGKPVSAERIRRFLWQRTEPEQLDRLVMALREQLGTNAILSIDDGFALNSAIVSSDVAEFERALSKNQFRDVEKVYVGTFLREPVLVDMPREFSVWLSDNRTSFRHRFVDAALAPGDRDFMAGPRGRVVPGWQGFDGSHSPDEFVPAGTVTSVFFGTNRRPLASHKNQSSLTFGSDRDERIHYGRCVVFVPKSHKIGQLGSSFLHRFFYGDDRLVLRSVTELDAPDTLWKIMRATLAEEPVGSKHAVVFIHGYNVTFHDAALRAAQLATDLAIPAMAFFSWPSRGKPALYVADEATIGASELAITEFLTDFAKLQDEQTSVHVIAHSMGNRALLRAIERIVHRAEANSGTYFNQIILAAPDVDRDEFRQLARVYAQACKRTTLYVSARDRALAGSQWIHAASRAGYAPPVTIVPGIDTVSVRNVDLSLLGHGYVAAASPVLYDMHDLIFHGTEPDRRMALRAQEDGEDIYWEVRA